MSDSLLLPAFFFAYSVSLMKYMQLCGYPTLFSSDAKISTSIIRQRRLRDDFLNESCVAAGQYKVNADLPVNDASVHTVLERVVKKCRTFQKYYFPSFIWPSNLQLIPYTFLNIFNKSSNRRHWAKEEVKCEDGEILVLDWYNEVPTVSDDKEAVILILHHGVNCRSNDLPGQQYIKYAAKKGWLVVCYNRRGHNAKLTKHNFNMFGNSVETSYIVETYIQSKRPQGKCLFLGFSAGSGIVARYMGDQGAKIKRLAMRVKREEGRELDVFGKDLSFVRKNVQGFIYSGVGICPGYNIERCLSLFAEPFHSLILKTTNDWYLGKNKALLEPRKDLRYDECMAATSLQGWLDETYKFAGFETKKAYYDHCNPMRTVEHTINPCLYLNAEDDPICSIQNLWEALYIYDKPNGAIVATVKAGSHCPFYQAGLWSLFDWNAKTFAEELALDWFDAILDEFGGKGG